MIKIENLFIQRPKELLKHCTLEVYRGAVTGILGKSGCGKTTVLQEIALLGHHQFKKYQFDDVYIHDYSPKQKNEFIKENICFVMQDIYLFEDLTISEILSLYGKLNNIELTDEDKFNSMEYVNLSLDLHTPVTILSGGEKQRLCIACGLLKDAQLYIFDEPFAYLDRSNAESIFDIIKKIAHEKKKYVLVATHDKEISSSLDMIYTFEDTVLTLTKDYESVYEYKVEKQTKTYLDALKYYLELYFKNNKVKIMIQSVALALIFSMLIVVNQYNNNFQKMHGESLLTIMQNEVVVQRKEGKQLQPRHVSQLISHYDDYEVYVPIYREGANDDSLNAYKPHQEVTYTVYKIIANKAYINGHEIKGDIYVSYNANRMLENNTYTFHDFQMQPIEIVPTKVLMPSEYEGQAVFIPYDEYIAILEKNNIDMTYMDHTHVLIPVETVSQIDEIQKRVPSGFEVWMEQSLTKSKDIAAIFEQEYVYIFMLLILIGIVFYKVYDVVKIRNDVILFKMNGISHSSIITMKAKQEFYSLAANISVAAIVVLVSSFVLDVLMVETYLYMMLLIIIANIILFIFIMIIYSFVIVTSKVSRLLRSA